MTEADLAGLKLGPLATFSPVTVGSLGRQGAGESSDSKDQVSDDAVEFLSQIDPETTGPTVFLVSTVSHQLATVSCHNALLKGERR